MALLGNVISLGDHREREANCRPIVCKVPWYWLAGHLWKLGPTPGAPAQVRGPGCPGCPANGQSQQTRTAAEPSFNLGREWARGKASPVRPSPDSFARSVSRLPKSGHASVALRRPFLSPPQARLKPNISCRDRTSWAVRTMSGRYSLRQTPRYASCPSKREKNPALKTVPWAPLSRLNWDQPFPH